MPGRPSLDFSDFVLRGPGRSRLVLALGMGVTCLALPLTVLGCSRPGTSRPVEDTETSGRISVVTSTDLEPLVRQEVTAFRAAHPQADLELEEARPSGQVVSELLAGRADVAVVGRELEPEERDMARRGGIEVEGQQIAQDGLCVVVPSANPVRNITVGELRHIWSGELREWSALGGPSARIVPVLPPLHADLARAFVQRVMAGDPMRAATLMEVSDSAAAARVARTPGAIGVVPLRFAALEGLRALGVSPLEGTPYVEPDMETVHDGSYALSSSVHAYLRTRRPRLAGGFLTHLTSQPGQELVLASGRVPTTVPLRFVRRSPMLGSH
jgi:phosphate transport system substrate-binding protein